MGEFEMKIKNGMGGSRCGKGRRDSTEQLKAYSRKARRAEAAVEAKAEEEEAVSPLEMVEDHWRGTDHDPE